MSCFPCFSSQRSSKRFNSFNSSRNGHSPPAQRDDPPPPHSDNKPKPSADKTNKDDNGKIEAQTFTFRELASATKNFRQECLLGEGGFGRVYKGNLENGGRVVAVKQLDRNGMGGNKEFLNEVLMLSRLHHENLVSLIGYCADGDQRLLVYEFMPLGSLEDHLLDISTEQKPLDWFTRMKIASDAAKGLEYLHEKADPPIIYRDLKASNILLDEGFNSKLSDFGLANLGPVGDKMHISSRVMGTYGYCAPEYTGADQLTVKSDVYSFGVVLLELITGRRAIDTTKPTEEQNLVSWAQPHFRDPKKYPEMADPLLQGGFPVSGLNQAVAIAAMCIQEEASVRPFISDVVSTLRFLAEVPPEKLNPVSVPSEHCKDKLSTSSLSSSSSSEEGEDEGSSEERERERAVAEAVEWGSMSRENSRKSHNESDSSK